MAATVISPRNTWTDGASGTVVNNAQLQIIYDKVDALIASNINFGGTVGSEGFGTHLLSSGGTGANTVRVRNTTGGTTHKGAVEVMGDAAQLTRLEHLSSTFTASGVDLANMGRLTCNASNGLNLETTAGLLRLVTTGGHGLAIHGSSLAGGSAIFQTGGAGSGFNGIAIAANIKDFATSTGSTAGTQGNTALESWLVDIGGFASTSGPFIADSFSINRRAAAGSWSALLTLTTSGLFSSVAIGVGNGTAAAPTYGFINDPDCGLYRVTTNVVGVATAGVHRTRWSADGRFDHDGGFAFRGSTAVISPASLTAAVNDWSPTGLETASVIRITTSGSGGDITGINSAAVLDGQLLLLVALSGSLGVNLRGASASSSAANRFALAVDRILAPGEMIWIMYDASSARWYIMGD